MPSVGATKAAEGPYSVEKASDPKDGRPWRVTYLGRPILHAFQEKYARESCALFNQMWKEMNSA